jgi:hypothetical protein
MLKQGGPSTSGRKSVMHERLIIDDKQRPISAPNDLRLVLDCSSTSVLGSTSRPTSAAQAAEKQRATTATPRNRPLAKHTASPVAPPFRDSQKAAVSKGASAAANSSGNLAAPASVMRAPGPAPVLLMRRGPPSPVKPMPGTGSSSPTGLFQPIQAGTPASESTQNKVAACESYLEEYWIKLHAYRAGRIRRARRLEEDLTELPRGEGADAAREQRRAEHSLKETFYLRGMRTKLSPEDFALNVRLGEGNYGKVFLVTKEDTGEVLALKVLNKAGMESKNRWRRAKAEREVTTVNPNPTAL